MDDDCLINSAAICTYFHW